MLLIQREICMSAFASYLFTVEHLSGPSFSKNKEIGLLNYSSPFFILRARILPMEIHFWLLG